MAAHARFRFKDQASLLEKIRSLDLDIPFSQDIDILFRPAKVNGRTLANRVAVLPMEGADAAPDGRPTELTFRRYKRFAQGGSGLIWFEATAVVAEGRSRANQLWLNARTLSGFRELVEETRLSAPRGGADGPPLLILQLHHAGRFARPDGERTPVVVHHNPHLDPRLGIPSDHPLCPDAALDRLIDDYVGAARLAAEAGFDGVDVKACHGYLVSDLLASHRRTDSRYGGSFEDRSRFMLDIVRRIRREVPDILPACRLGVFDGIPFPYGFGVDHVDERREDLSEPAALVGKLKDLGVSLVSLSLGVPFLKPHLSRPYDLVHRGDPPPDEHPLEGIGRLMRLTGELQRRFPDLVVVGAGYSWLRQFWPQAAAGALSRDRASVVGLGRAALAYPEALPDLSAEGRLRADRVCLTCSRCAEMLHNGRRVGCPVRDKEIYAAEYKLLDRARTRPDQR